MAFIIIKQLIIKLSNLCVRDSLPRKQNLAVYFMVGFSKHVELSSQLGKHSVGKSCLYINKLSDVDLTVLEQLILASWAEMDSRYLS
jgi:hypothetical protein